MSGGGEAVDPRPAAIRVAGVTKLYRRLAPGAQWKTLKSALLDGTLTRDLDPAQAIAALREVDFTVGRGESFGVIGGNGSGKSTLLKLVAGILQPTTGRVVVDGRVAALIELGAGFHPEISGRENVYVNGSILGLTRREIDRRLESIIAFSGLVDFIDEPVKNYSSGMYVRLGFAVAVHTEPDILLVDEVLAVGDEAFAHKCLRKIEELLAAGRTLLFVSHALDLVETLCDRVLWLEDGRPRLIGEPRRVVDAYRQAVAEEEGREHLAEKEERQRRETLATGDGESDDPTEDDPEGEAVEGETDRWGSRQVEIAAARLTTADGERYHLVSGEQVAFEIDVVAPRPLSDFVFGVRVATPRGTEIWGTNSHLAGFEPDELSGTATVRVVCPSLELAPGEYLLDIAVHSREGAPYDYWSRALGFSVTSPRRGIGVYFPEHRWEVTGGVRWRAEDHPTDRRPHEPRSDDE